VSVATACMLPGSVAQQVAGFTAAAGSRVLEVEHPTGFFSVEIEVAPAAGEEAGGILVKRAALLRTARLLMRGEVLIPAAAWKPAA
jgi:4-oxalomesaconate tautomerase